MKYLLVMLLLCGISAISQSRYITKTGVVEFEASVPSFEEVKAINESVTAIINAETGEFAALVLVKGFRFKNALMEEHFNENYAESDSYPKATFKGKISDFKQDRLAHQSKIHKISGELTFHGITKTIEAIEATISIDNNTISIGGNFKLKASDFDIKIPKVVSKKIAEDIEVAFRFFLNEK